MSDDNVTCLPGTIQFIISDKVGVITFERVEDKRLVRLWDLALGESPLVRQVHLSRHCAGLQTRGLGVNFDVDSLAGLDPEDKFVTSDILENALGDVSVLDPNLHFGFIQGYAIQRRSVRVIFKSY